MRNIPTFALLRRTAVSVRPARPWPCRSRQSVAASGIERIGLGLRCASVSMAEALCQGAHVFPTAFLASDRPVSAAEIMRRTLVGYR